MLTGMIGVPSSGKTTISTTVFARLKTAAVNTELILEEARRYISEKRFKENLVHNSKIVLTNDDQLRIAYQQYTVENNFKHSCGPNTIIISDSSVYNAYLYMTRDLTEKPEVQEFFFKKLLSHYDLLLFCFPVDREFVPTDSNRVHTKEELHSLDLKARNLLEKLKSLKVPVEVLVSEQEVRVNDANSIILTRYCQVLESTSQKEFEIMAAN